MAEEVSISSVSASSLETQVYSSQDINLLNEFELNRDFGAEQDIIEYHIFDTNNNLLSSSYDYTSYSTQVTNPSSSLYNTLYIDPDQDLNNSGFNIGEYNVLYKFYRPVFLSSNTTRYFIKEISSDRTEIQISTNDLSYNALGTSYFNYITSKAEKTFYSDLLLNFGDNNTLIAVNTLLDTEDTAQAGIFVKLYEPLPAEYGLKDTLYIVEEISDPISFQVNIQFTSEETEEVEFLRGPNTNIDLNDKTNTPTKYFNTNELLGTVLTSSFQQVQSVLEEKGISINIDYTDYNNFVQFSSAYDRLANFKHKLTQIQSFQSDLNTIKGLNPLTDQTSISASEATLQENINTLIEQFDGYEYFLYFESGSKSWPKSNSTPPFNNFSVTSDSASVWYGSKVESDSNFGGQSLSASLYDTNNLTYVWNTLPTYVQEDTQNQNLELLVSMLGQHFDTIWTYTRAITDITNADNRIDRGISKDIVADTLRSLGIKLYTSNRTNQDVFTTLLGITPSGSLVPETGSLRVETYISASNDVTPYDDISKEVYKRIYHNLPYLLKTKGSYRGLRALLNCFGIEDTILRIHEYGGIEKNVKQITQFYENHVYALDTRRSSSVEVPWLPSLMPIVGENWENIDQDWNNIEGWWNGVLAEDQVPDTVQFRFKASSIPSASYATQSLFQVNTGSATQFGIQLRHTSASFGEMKFILSGSQGYVTTSPMLQPFFTGGFWDVMLRRDPGKTNLNQTGSVDVTYELVTKNSRFDGDNSFIQYQDSSSLFISSSTSSSYNEAWSTYTFSSENTHLLGYLGGTGSNNVIAPNNIIFDGEFQEFRYWITSLSQSKFDEHVLNPTSYVDNDITSSYYNLVYRLPLGNYDQISGSDGDNKITSVHPMVTGSFAPTGSFLGTGSSTVNFAIINNFTGSSFKSESRVDAIQGPDLGGFVTNDNKVRVLNNEIISGSTLSPYVSVQINQLSSSVIDYTPDLDIAEIAISPQNSIDQDIINQFGFFDIDEYIGDPTLSGSLTYPKLDELKDFYFRKYFQKTSVLQSIRLLSYFDNSLFKMLRDFVPAKTLLNTGLVIKPTILERTKVEKFEPTFTYIDYSGSTQVVSVTGSNPMDKDLNTSYTGEVIIPSSSANTITASGVIFNFNDLREPFTGEFSGSELTVYTLPTSSTVTELSFFNKEIDSNTMLTYSAMPLNPTLNNISEPRKSIRFMDLDYSSNPIVPVNIGFITSRSLGTLSELSSSFLDAPVQDSNYTLLRSKNPRYLGSKNTSQKYNTFTVGDTSFGQTAAIDLNSLKFAYFSEIVETGSAFPERSNVYIKYLIDGRSNIIELTRNNENIFDLQNIFNAKKEVDISLDNNQLFGDQKYLDGLKPVYAGGFKYLPTLQNPTGSSNLNYRFTAGPIENLTKEDIFPIPNSLGGKFVNIGDFTLGTIQIQSGSNSISVGGYPAITLTRSEPINRESIWWDNDLLINVEGQVELEINVPKNVSASFDTISWNPFNGVAPIFSASTDFGDFELIEAIYHISNSVILPKNTDKIEAIFDESISAMGGQFETSFETPDIVSASVNIGGLQAASFGTPAYTYYFPSDPMTSFTSSIVDGGDANNGNAFFLRNNTGSFNILTASVSMSFWYDNFTQTSSIYESGSDSYGIIDERFVIEEGDLFRFVDKAGGVAGSGSGEFPVSFERQVKRVSVIPRDEVTNTRRLTIEFDKDIPARACEDFTTTNPDAARQIKRFVILKKVEDETNIVLNFEKQPGQTSTGIVLPADLPQTLQEKAGNIVKELKSQNLIT
jgi:ABC-type uncharacterized transport system substrate-binding protein